MRLKFSLKVNVFLRAEITEWFALLSNIWFCYIWNVFLYALIYPIFINQYFSHFLKVGFPYIYTWVYTYSDMSNILGVMGEGHYREWILLSLSGLIFIIAYLYVIEINLGKSCLINYKMYKFAKTNSVVSLFLAIWDTCSNI